MKTRVCVLCDWPYEAGRYRDHAQSHNPVRKGRTGGEQSPIRDEVRRLFDMGVTQSTIARAYGISRQRVHQMVRPDALGRNYHAQMQLDAQRRERGW